MTTENIATERGNSEQQHEQAFSWNGATEAFTDTNVANIAEWRGYSQDIVQYLRGNEMIGVVDGLLAFRSGNGAHVRTKDGKWFFKPSGQSSPFIFGQIEDGANVHCFESQWDAIALADSSGERSNIIASRGATNVRRIIEALPANFTGTLILWPQNDEAGQKWAADIRSRFKGKIKLVSIPAGHKDLNDWTKAGATGDEVFNAFVNAKDYQAEPEQGNSHKSEVEQISSIDMKAVRFIDKPLFQENAFHLLVGKKNTGKGTFLISVAARFTRGELGPKCNVLWIAAGEDDYGMDVKPRLIAAGGIVERFYKPKSRQLRLPSDIPALMDMVRSSGDAGLVVLDPISGMLPSGTNTNMDSDVRAAIGPLNDLASDLGCLVVGVRHLKKENSRGALESILGSTDWANVPRSVLAIAMDDEEQDVRHVQVVAGNRLPRGTASRSFRIIGAHVVEGGEPVAKAEFLEGNGKDVDDMLRSEQPDTKKRSAEMQILDELEKADDLGEDIRSSDLIRLVREVCSASEKTIRNATDHLKELGLIRFVPRKDENGKILEWHVRRSELPRPKWLIKPHGNPAQI